jgi:hypothetical protein
VNKERPRRRLRQFLRVDDEHARRPRRRSLARRDHEPPEVADEDIVRGVWGDDAVDAWAGGWPESLRNRYADCGCSLPPLPRREN